MNNQIAYSWQIKDKPDAEIEIEDSELSRAAINIIQPGINDGDTEGDMEYEADGIIYVGYWALYDN